MSTRAIAPLLQPHLELPEQANSLTLLTGVLGASTNWLVLKYLVSILARPQTGRVTYSHEVAPPLGSHRGNGRTNAGDGMGDIGEQRVVLVSFMRDFVFWRDGAKRLGLDLEKLSLAGRFAFVDGLSGLFTPATQDAQNGAKHAGRVLQDASVDAVVKYIRAVMYGLGSGGRNRDLASQSSEDRSRDDETESAPVVLIIDQLDYLLAVGGASSVSGMEEALLDLREQSHATILALAADKPLIMGLSTPLESQHAAFVLGLAHQARHILSLRLLDSGVASDVSGVLAVTQGGSSCQRELGELQARGDDAELLYHIGGDGNVKVFERGA